MEDIIINFSWIICKVNYRMGGEGKKGGRRERGGREREGGIW